MLRTSSISKLVSCLLAPLALASIAARADVVIEETMNTDGVAGFNVHSIALEIPTNELTGTGHPPTSGASDAQTLGIWAAASRRKFQILQHDPAPPQIDRPNDLGGASYPRGFGLILQRAGSRYRLPYRPSR